MKSVAYKDYVINGAKGQDDNNWDTLYVRVFFGYKWFGLVRSTVQSIPSRSFETVRDVASWVNVGELPEDTVYARSIE